MSIGSIVCGIILLCINVKITLENEDAGWIWNWHIITGVLGFIILCIAPNGTFINEVGIILFNNLVSFLILMLSVEIKDNLTLKKFKEEWLLFFYLVYYIAGIFIFGILFN